MNLIEVKNLNFGYSSQYNILKNINLKIKRGEFVSIVGRNGSGKSTLLKCILGLNEKYKGEIIKEKYIGYLPQKNDIQSNFPATIEEIVLSGTMINNINSLFYKKKDKENAYEIMKKLNLYDMRKKSFSNLSGGEQQRVLIARALCSTKDIIILDEPTNGLDPNIAVEIYKLLEKLKKEENITILMVSHDIFRTLNYTDRIIEMENGEIIFDGSVNDYKREVIK